MKLKLCVFLVVSVFAVGAVDAFFVDCEGKVCPVYTFANHGTYCTFYAVKCGGFQSFSMSLPCNSPRGCIADCTHCVPFELLVAKPAAEAKTKTVKKNLATLSLDDPLVAHAHVVRGYTVDPADPTKKPKRLKSLNDLDDLGPTDKSKFKPMKLIDKNSYVTFKVPVSFADPTGAKELIHVQLAQIRLIPKLSGEPAALLQFAFEIPDNDLPPADDVIAEFGEDLQPLDPTDAPGIYPVTIGTTKFYAIIRNRDP